MKNMNHWAVFLANNVDKQTFIQQILSKKVTAVLTDFNELTGVLFSKITIDELIDDENRHGFTAVTKTLNRSLKSMSSGEQKKALLTFLIAQKPDFIILDNPFDNLDIAAQQMLLEMLHQVSKHTLLIQLINRERDLLPFITHAVSIEKSNKIVHYQDINVLIDVFKTARKHQFSGLIPPPIRQYQVENSALIEFNSVNVSYGENHILKDITWTINPNEFWHLVGPNGAGKTTILSMITGDNPKGYGQNLVLFGRKKGSGESVWAIKDKIGYVTPAMTDLFNTRHTLEQMLLSGFFDSIGLYIKPSDLQVKLAQQWLNLIELTDLRKKPFFTLSMGQQRLALVVRAMVKHPPLLILDEAIAGLDDKNAALVIALINKIATESNTTILYVSHQNEEQLKPKKVFQLIPSAEGSRGMVIEANH
jgi:molybdate transport system ATP-binding protein